LHKAARFARQVLGTDSVVLRQESVLLFPDDEVTIDAVRFHQLAHAALDGGDAATAGPAADAYGGPLLPDDRYEPWTEPHRDRLELLYQDPAAARAMVDAAEATFATTDSCAFCSIMFAVPAAIACADVGDVAQARRHLARAERSAGLWEGTAWQAATLEARAHLARAEGDADGALRLLTRAAELFDDSAQPLDAARLRAKLAGPVG
jgi:hypothetical protein